MEPSEEIGREFGEIRRPEGFHVELEAEGTGDGIGTDTSPAVGMAYEHDGHKMVCGIFPGKPAAISGLLRDSTDSYSSDTVCPEEVGLLDSMAFC